MKRQNQTRTIGSKKQNSKPNLVNKVQNLIRKKEKNYFVCGKLGHHVTQCCHKRMSERSILKVNLAETEVNDNCCSLL